MKQEASTFTSCYDFVKVSVFTIQYQILITDVYRIVNDICPPIVKILFSFRENKYNLRNFQEMNQERIETIRTGLETALYHCSTTKFPRI